MKNDTSADSWDEALDKIYVHVERVRVISNMLTFDLNECEQIYADGKPVSDNGIELWGFLAPACKDFSILMEIINESAEAAEKLTDRLQRGEIVRDFKVDDAGKVPGKSSRVVRPT
jgi:hypothetical protein